MSLGAALLRYAGSRLPVMSEKISITASINGTEHTATVEPRRSLVDFLRHDLGLVGTHVGCEHGVCGACTVMLDGRTVRSCLLFRCPGRRLRSHHHRRHRDGRSAPSLAAGISATPCAAMRLLHAGNDLGGPRTAARQRRSKRRRNTRRHQRQSLHVHGLRQYRARGARRCAKRKGEVN